MDTSLRGKNSGFQFLRHKNHKKIVNKPTQKCIAIPFQTNFVIMYRGRIETRIRIWQLFFNQNLYTKRIILLVIYDYFVIQLFCLFNFS